MTRTSDATIAPGEEAGTGQAVKRRGILAAAGAVVAGIVAKQASQPVAAGTDGDIIAAKTTPTYGPTVVSGREPGVFPIVPYGFGGDAVFTGDATTLPDINLGTHQPYSVAGVKGIGKGASAGVVGVGGGDTQAGFPIGVRGSVANTGFGVYGLSGVGTGVYGQGVYGVYGNGGGIGVLGQSSGGNGVYGEAFAAGTTSVVAGVYGTSTVTYGILGNTTAAGYSGLTGTTNTPGVAALAATALVPSAFAAYFTGLTYVQGDFAVTGNKSAAVMHPDGTRRLLYCVESPEAWFEDFGEAKLIGGKAEVKLDTDFALLVHADMYHVFLTPGGECKGLSVAGKGASGFIVRELQGGASSLTFSYRVVAKRKDNPGKRLEKFVPIKINIPDPDKLPRPPVPGKKP